MLAQRYLAAALRASTSLVPRHLVNRRWADAKIFLHVGFGRRLAVQARIGMDKRQILTLLGRKGFCRATHAGHPIQLFIRASSYEEPQMNVRYRVELSQAERSELTALLSGGKHSARKLKRAQILLPALPAPATSRSRPTLALVSPSECTG